MITVNGYRLSKQQGAFMRVAFTCYLQKDLTRKCSRKCLPHFSTYQVGVIVESCSSTRHSRLTSRGYTGKPALHMVCIWLT